MNNTIEFNHVSAAYRGHIALRNLSFNVPSGRIIGIAGSNGSGKTTILRVIQGLVPITSGAARVFGLDLIPANFRRIRTETSCVFQLLEVDPRMPVLAREAVMMGRYGKMTPFQRPSGKDFDCVRRAMDQADALHLANRPFGQLSGGERQRINLARALAQEPKLLLLDEPTTFLDRDSRLRIADTIKAVHERYSLTTVIVSHESRVLNELCDDIIHIENGSSVINEPVTGETYD